MNEMVSLRKCANLLGVTPMTLSRWLRANPQIKVHKITTRAYAMRPQFGTFKQAQLNLFVG